MNRALVKFCIRTSQTQGHLHDTAGFNYESGIIVASTFLTIHSYLECSGGLEFSIFFGQMELEPFMGVFYIFFSFRKFRFEISKVVHFKNNTFHNWDETSSQICDRLYISIAKSLNVMALQKTILVYRLQRARVQQVFGTSINLTMHQQIQKNI